MSSRQWQRSSRPIVSDLISESSQVSVAREPEVIDIIVKNNKLYSQLEIGVE